MPLIGHYLYSLLAQEVTNFYPLRLFFLFAIEQHYKRNNLVPVFTKLRLDGKMSIAEEIKKINVP